MASRGWARGFHLHRTTCQPTHILLRFLTLIGFTLLILLGGPFTVTPLQADSFTVEDTTPAPLNATDTELCQVPLQRTFDVQDNFVVTDLNVGFTANHPFRSDIRLVLRSPQGTQVEILTEFFKPVLDENANYDILLDDESLNPLDDGDDDDTTAPFYERTVTPTNPLSTFVGEIARGLWTLDICDAGIADDGAYVRSLLAFEGDPIPTEGPPDQISGTVYRDYSADGIRDPGDGGQANIIATAYDARGTLLDTATTDEQGRYTLSVPSGTEARVEFTNIPSFLSAGPAGPDSRTTLVFVTSPATFVDVGLNNPGQYCQSPEFTRLTTSCFAFGPNDGPYANEPSVLSFEETAGSFDIVLAEANLAPYDAPQVTEATHAQTGAALGLAYNARNESLYTASFVKRHSGLGPTGNPTTIYAIEPGTGNNSQPWFTLDATRTDPHNNPADWTEDFDVIDIVGKEGWGDIDVAENGSALYGVDLGERQLVIIPILNDGSAGTHQTMDILDNLPATILGAGAGQCPTQDDLRPFGLGVRDGTVYLGVVCSAQSTVPAGSLPIPAPTNANPPIIRPGDVTKLWAYVFTWNGNVATPDFDLVLDFNLDYLRGCVIRSPNPDCVDRWLGTWAPWVNTYPFSTFGQGGNFEAVYPQPMLSDIEFYNGDMIIFLGDRFGHQTAFDTQSPHGDALGKMSASGDILYACRRETGWVMEENISGDDSCGTAGLSFIEGDKRLDEYFFEDTYSALYTLHDDVNLGAGAVIPGRNQVIAAVYDPVYRSEIDSTLFDGGLHWYSIDDGHWRKSIRIYDGTASTPGDGTFNKAAGIGDMTALCDPAPIEIGNRVWFDENANGIQDAGEPGVDDVRVELLRPGIGPDGLAGSADDAQPIATAVTAHDGSYYFSSAASTSTAHAIYNLNLLFGASYQIQIPDAVGANQQAPLHDWTLTETDDNATTLTGSDLSDSDGFRAGGDAIINLVIGNPGDNNHTYDFGFVTLPAAIGNYVWLDEDADGEQDAGEQGIPHVIMNLTNRGGSVFTTTTDADGGYLFANLPPGTYTITVSAANSNPGTPLATYAQSTHPVRPNADFGNQTAPYRITVGPGEENLTADFGYIRNPQNVNNNSGLAKVGDRVWMDINRNGAQDASEAAIAGVTVTLLGPGADGLFGTPDDAALATQTTNANGHYMFEDLPPGAYVVALEAGGPLAGYEQTGDPDHYGTTGSNDGRTTFPVVLAPGDVLMNVDFGYAPTVGTPVGRIGDFVWLDADASAGPEPAKGNEYGIPGVTVALLRDTNGDGRCTPLGTDGLPATSDDEPILAVDVTDTAGRYLFEGLPLDDGDGDAEYVVWVNDTESILLGLMPTFDANGLSTPGCAGTTLNANTTQDLTLDFSYTPIGQTPTLGALGDTVWLNVNGNSTQESNEPGIEGVIVTLELTGGGLLTTTTDENGHYYFGALNPAAIYTVTVSPLNFVPGGMLEGLSNTADPEGDNNHRSLSNLAVAGPIDLTRDFGYTASQLGRIGNLVWLDSDADGSFTDEAGPDGAAATDDDEPIIGSVTLDLMRDLNCNEQVDAGEGRLATKSTAAAINEATFRSQGVYLFEGLPGGCYIVRVSDRDGVLTGYWHSLGANDGQNNNSQPDGYALTLAAGGENLTADFGYYVEPACLGNYVWLDADEDGLQDPTETPLANVRVTLTIDYPAGDTVTLQTRTDANGHYQFCNLLADEDYRMGSASNGSDELPVYTLSVSTPTGMRPTGVDVGSNGSDRTDSDSHSGVAAQPVQGLTDVAAHPAPATEPAIASYDFGFVRVERAIGVNLGNCVWFDADSDGIQERDEPGIAGARMMLYAADGTTPANDSNGQPVALQTTAGDGCYNFQSLAPGDYVVRITPPAGYTPTAPQVANPESNIDRDSNIASTVAPGVYQSGVINLSVENEPDVGVDGDGPNGNLTVDFGFVGIELGNFVWIDANGDSLQNDGSGLDGVQVSLTLPNGSTRTTTTANGGYYTFTNVMPGQTYTIIVTPPDGYGLTGQNATDDTQDSDADGLGRIVVNLGTVNDYTFDAGLVEAVNVGNCVWFDANADGRQDGDEPGIAGARLELFAADGSTSARDLQARAIAPRITESDGCYGFRTLAPGSYIVQITPPPGYSPTVNQVAQPNNDVDRDSNIAREVAPKVYQSGPIELAIGGEPESVRDGDGRNGNLTVDFGFLGLTLGSYVWVDANHDGIRNDGSGLDGVTIILTLPDGSTRTTVTSNGGVYTFTNLMPNQIYTLTFIAPPRYRFAQQDVGDTAEEMDSDVDGDGRVVVRLGTENNLTINAGLVTPTALEKEDEPDDSNVTARLYLPLMQR